MKTERQKMLAGELYFAPLSLSLAQAPYHRSDISMALSVTGVFGCGQHSTYTPRSSCY